MASVDADIAPVTDREPAERHKSPRADIQAVRAFAVMAVVVFHVWPGAVTGGYIGVDVFFVISGYLITGQLLRLRQSGALRLGAFWAARARRLLPAALLVLLVSTVLTFVFAPPALVTQYLRSIVGSGLYIENWVLASDAVDYLAADNAPPIAQHYWSLSVEEQFYLIWPLIIIAATASVFAKRWGTRAIMGTLAAITAVSLVLCIAGTMLAPSVAYFATLTRMWEFGAGALVAALPARSLPRRVRSAAWAVGWAVLVGTALLYDADTPFPGYAAVLPVVATAGIILAGPTAPFRIAAVQGIRPVQWLGDNSYGIYLWHWPLVVIAPAALGAAPDLWQNVVLVMLTFVLAALGKRFIEDPLRFRLLSGFRPRTILIGTAVSMIAVTVAAGLPAVAIAQASQHEAAEARAEVADPSTCRGASMMLSPSCDEERRATFSRDALVPGLAGLYDDTDGAFACYASGDEPSPPCHFGSSDPDAIRLAVTGDSHAAMLIPGLRDAAERAGWSVDVYVGRGCVWSSDPDPACQKRREAVNTALLSKGYDAVIVAAWNQLDATEKERTERAAQFADRWRTATEAGIAVIPVLDNPAVPQKSAECLTTSRTFAFSTCAFPASEYLLTDPLAIAARSTGVTAVDLRSAYCDDAGVCPVVAGGVVVYRDLHHITATFSHSLSRYLEEKINSVMDATASGAP